MRGSACEKVVLPEHAHLNSSGDGWVCGRPYRQSSTTCVAP
jgi:hypothetical protein